MSQVWIDGALVDKNDAKVSVFDHGLLFGDGVTEGMRAYGGSVFRLAEHLDRLFASADAIALKLTMTRPDFAAAIAATLAANGRADGYVKVVVTRGAGTLGLDPRKCEPQVIVIAEDVVPFPRELYAVGLDLVTTSVRWPLPHPVGTLSRVAGVLAKREALQAGCLEAVVLDAAGSVVGGAESDLAAVYGNTVRLPNRGGVTQQFVAELAERAGSTVVVGGLNRDDLTAADELFLTSAEAEQIGVRSLDGSKVGGGGEGPITRQLREAFRAATRGV
ncbi:MAG: aminotransferase class IV [Gemmataceae bacterium]